jgi:pimeloyl-ACP methyl ester carboxylesterase
MNADCGHQRISARRFGRILDWGAPSYEWHISRDKRGDFSGPMRLRVRRLPRCRVDEQNNRHMQRDDKRRTTTQAKRRADQTAWSWSSRRGVDFCLVRSTLFLVGLAVAGVSLLGLRPDWQSAPHWRDPSPHQVRWITVDSSVRLEVLDWGGSGPPLILLGCYLTAHVHDEFAPKLTNQFHVYGITRRGIGASDKPATGYTVQRSVDDVLGVLGSLNLQKSLLVGTSCAGQILTMFASQHSDRLSGLVYLDGAGDPTTPAYDPPMPDPTTLPRSIKPPPAPDYTSFEAYRIAQRRDQKVAFPEAELRQQFVANPDGSVGRSLLSPEIRRAITVDARVKPNYAGIRVPVLAIYQVDRPFEEVAADSVIRNEQERAALRQQYAATRAMYARWQHDLLAGVPSARIVELPGASLFMFLSNEADVLREVRAFAATLTHR